MIVAGDVHAFDPAKLFHLGYVVANMERALTIWQRMGAAVMVPAAEDTRQRVSCALLSFQEAVLIELVCPLTDDSPVRGRLSKGGGLDHVCLFSDNVQADVLELEAQGAMVVVQPCYGEVFDRDLAFVLTRGGLVVELMSREPIGRIPNDPIGQLAMRRA